MRKLLGTLVLLALVVGVVGFSRGWFSISADSVAGESKIQMTIDRERVHHDADQVKEKIREISDSIHPQ